MKLNSQWVEFILFCIVGAICTLIDYVVFWLLHQLTGYRIAMVSGFVLSLAVNYYLNIYWTFSEKPSKKNAVGMIGAHLFNLFVVRLCLMFLFVELLQIIESVAYVFTLTISAITNFLIIRFVVRRQ